MSNSWTSVWNANNFSYNAYNMLEGKQPWLYKKTDIYINPNTKIAYVGKNRIESYTGMSFWYKRGKFSGPKQYLDCYNLPYSDSFFSNSGYISNPKSCGKLGRKNGWNKTQGGFHFYE